MLLRDVIVEKHLKIATKIVVLTATRSFLFSVLHHFVYAYFIFFSKLFTRCVNNTLPVGSWVPKIFISELL
jgi:hypothetical protein